MPSNSITALAAGADGSLWIGTSYGLTRYRNGRFTTYTTSQGLPDNSISSALEDHAGTVWIVAGIFLSRFQDGRFTNFSPRRDLPIDTVRTVYEDRGRNLWIAGYGGVARLEAGKFKAVIGPAEMQPDMTVVAEAANGQQAVELYRKHVPDVTLLDLRMPVLSGVDAALEIRREYPHARLIALTTYGGDEDIRRALQAGVQAYLTKDVLHDELLKAIRAVHEGQTYIPMGIAAALAARMPRAELSAREMEVLELIVKGLANKQIAYTLNIAEHTVKNHVKSILSKLDVEDRTQAATAAIQRGIVHL